MSQRWKLWFGQRGRRVGAIIGALLLALLALLLVTGDSSAGLAFLGDVTRPRQDAAVSNGAMLPRAVDPNAPLAEAPSSAVSTLLDTPAGASGGPQQIEAAQATWSAEEIARHQQEVLTALNCVRQQQGVPKLTLDPTLTQVAGEAWLQLTRDRSFSLMQIPGIYPLRSVMTLDFAVDPALTGQAGESGAPGTSDCGVGGFDAATLEVAMQASRIGIAVFPPQASWDGSSAVVLVQ